MLRLYKQYTSVIYAVCDGNIRGMRWQYMLNSQALPSPPQLARGETSGLIP